MGCIGRVFKFFGFMVVAFIALVVIGSMMMDDTSETTTGVSEPRVETQAAQKPTEEPERPPASGLMTGIVTLMGYHDASQQGQSCSGSNDKGALTEGRKVTVTRIGGWGGEREATLSSGTVDKYGHCVFAFGIEKLPGDGGILFGFDDDLYVECDQSDLWTTEAGNDAVNVRFAPNGAYCQPR